VFPKKTPTLFILMLQLSCPCPRPISFQLGDSAYSQRQIGVGEKVGAEETMAGTNLAPSSCSLWRCGAVGQA
jgi:hypothetical protein